MAFVACGGPVRIAQGEVCLSVIERFGHSLLPPRLHMALFTRLAYPSRHEFAAVRVRVTVGTLPELLDHEPGGPGFLAAVTALAGQTRMFPPQREARRAMIEMCSNACAPPRGGMTALAGLLELAGVWVFMACRTGCERDAVVRHEPARRRGAVAFSALHVLVPARQGEAGLLVREA